MFGTILSVFALVFAALVLVVGLHVAVASLMRAGYLPRSSAGDGAALFTLIGAGAVGLWVSLGGPLVRAESVSFLSPELKGSAILLYLTGGVVYLEIKSLVARGYSLRILVDILEAGGKASVTSLKMTYGGGLGVDGLLVKRLRTLADLGIIRLQGNHVGPLTTLGKTMAMTGLRLRQILRLELVG